MKLRHLIFFAISATLLAACNFRLAADVTPPPGYVPPTPAPTLGPLFPASAPNPENGAKIYEVKCAPCHGTTGLGDGPKGKELQVTVAAFALPETARKASPAAWYTTVTQGNIDRFMPPFASLNDQERWDVVAYALTLHTTTDQIELGKSIFEKDCADCAKSFSNLEMMSALSEDQVVKMIKGGQGDVPAFGASLSDEEVYAVAAYIRTLTFAAPVAPVVEAATETPAAAATDSGTPSAESTPLDATAQALVTPEATEAPVASAGRIIGLIENRSGTDLSSDQTITLHVYDHSSNSDPNAGPTEVYTLDGTINPDGSYSFDNVEVLDSQIYLAELEVDGLVYQSDFEVGTAGATELALPNIVIYATTEELTDLVMDNVIVHFDFTSADSIGVFVVYSMHNTGDKNIKVTLENDGKSIPFIKAPANSTADLGFQITQNSAPLIGTMDGSGFFIQPSDQPYELVAFTNLPRDKKTEFSQELVLAAATAQIFVPEGVTAKGDQLSSDGLVPMQGPDGNNTNFQTYSTGSIKAGDTITFTLTGEPKTVSVSPDLTQNKNLLIGIGALGLVLILAGVWMYMRDGSKKEEEAEEEDVEFDDSESIMDAIIAIDELHRAGKLSDQAYKERREELKNALKRKS
jgi:mono/diheme cytochrome c family protein